MPALHIVGEIVGASGLRPQDALSAVHWLDFLSLHPSSRRSFFCRWRLGFQRFDKPPTLKETEDWSQWRVLQGACHGQTQVHAYSAVTPLDETVTTSSSRRSTQREDGEETEQEVIELETLWCHPIDLHLAVHEMLPFPISWPFLEFQVSSLDELHCERLVGTASLPLPLAQHEFFLDLPLTTREPPASSVRETLADLLDLRHARTESDFVIEKDEEIENDDEPLVTTSVGTLYVRLAIVQQNFLERGVFS